MNYLSITPDMLRAARSRQGSGRPHVLPDRSKFGRNSMMTQAAVPVSKAQLQELADEVTRLSVKLQRLLAHAGVDVAPPPATPADVVNLDSYRVPRQVVHR